MFWTISLFQKFNVENVCLPSNCKYADMGVGKFSIGLQHSQKDFYVEGELMTTDGSGAFIIPVLPYIFSFTSKL